MELETDRENLKLVLAYSEVLERGRLARR